MIEVQIKNKEIYNRLVQYANYHSDITGVCSFRDELFPMLQSNGLIVEKPKEMKSKPILDIQGTKVMKLVHAPAEMLHFVGVVSEYDPTIPITHMHEVNLLVQNGLVEPSKKMNEVYAPMGYRSKISELISANLRFYGRGKLIDYIDKDLSIMSLNFNQIKEKNLVYKQMELQILGPLEDKGKYWQIASIDKGGVKVLLNFFSKPALLKSIAFEGNVINVSASKVTEIGINFSITDPIILPRGLQLIKDIMVMPPNRKIPVMHYRNAYYEFMYRYHLSK